MSDRGKPAPDLLTPVQYLKGVGPQRAELLKRLGLCTAADVLFYFPRDYQDLSDMTSVTALQEGALVRLRGLVAEVDWRPLLQGRSVLGVLLHCEGGCVRLIWFNQTYLRDRFTMGEELVATGKVRMRGLVWELVHPEVQTLDADPGFTGGLLPVYPLTEGLSQRTLRQIVRSALEVHAPLLEEALPAELLARHDLPSISEALHGMHVPESAEMLARARRRLAYQELLVLQLALAIRRHQNEQAAAPRLAATPKIDARIRRLFPFDFTAGQREAISAIVQDLESGRPMNRLLLGDVGSGKTVVAVYALLLAVANGYQAVLMAPTEVLARQHALTLERTLRASRVRWDVLVGGLDPAQRRKLLERIREGELDLVIGTHAVLQEGVEFARLALVVIDEQHKFGVRERAVLKRAGAHPHYLVMTATPIPRTLAMTLFGDLDISTVRDAPPGRQPVRTYLAGPEQRQRWWQYFRRKLEEGRQGYVVVPLVEESEELDAVSVGEAYQSLAAGPLAGIRLGLLHGRLPAAEKQEVMERFRQGQLQVLVATTVIEVGIDVPNATLMTIEGGERFGLSQLHQLRGRISRGNLPGFCCVFANPTTPEAEARLRAFAETNDGFALAEADFRLRGPGELLGTRQHGLPPLRVADLRRDAGLLEQARQDAQALVRQDPGLARPELARLRRLVLARYGKVLELGDVG
ncbi:MAG: ATP-dependent DNA helicase RecG [Pirellulales bacterium]|nr:ATP-dependent DNA helicase RecG [Pirellulales bacterium]